MEDRISRADVREQSRAGAKFQVVGRTEDFIRGAVFDGEEGFGNFLEVWAEDWVGQVGFGFIEACDGVVL